MKLSTKLFIIILEITIIPLLIVGYVFYFNIKQQITQNVFSKLDAIAQIQKDRIQENIDDKINLLDLSVSKLGLLALLDSYNNNPTKDLQKNLEDDITQTNASSDVIEQVSIANPAGVIVASTEPGLTGSNISKEDYFKKGIKQNDVSFIFRDAATGKPARYLVGPLVLRGKTIGIIILNTDTTALTSLVNDYTGLGSTGETLLAKKDVNGDALFLTPIRFDKNAALTRVVSKNETNVPSVHAVNGEEKMFDNAVDYRGVKVFASTRYIPSIGWGIVVKIDQQEALAPLAKEQILNLLIFFSVILLIIIISYSISYSITNPIKKLASLTKKVAEGDLSQSVKIVSKDEVGVLSKSFNDMIIAVKKSRESIDKKVAEQTKDIQEKQKFLEDQQKATLNVLEDIEEEKTKTSAFLASLGEGVIATDVSANVIFMNKSAEDMLGWKLSDVMGKSLYSFLSVVDPKGKKLSEEERPFHSAIREGKKISVSIQNDYYCIKRDGGVFPIAITAAPVLVGKKIIGAIDVFRDVTNEKQIDKAKTEFVSLASHQLRTPATAVKWYSEMLLDPKMGKLTKKQKKYMNEVYHGNERMIKLVDNLLNISRMELGKITVKSEPIEAQNIFGGVIDEQKSEVLRRKQKLIVDQPKETIKLMADPFLLRMILQNFLSNSVKYTQDGGEIICSIKKEGEKITFFVRDNGFGIPKDEQKRIFERFYRATNSLSLDKEGTGLGLYIVRQMAYVMGGKTWFESDPGKQTTFYLELPLRSVSR